MQIRQITEVHHDSVCQILDGRVSCRGVIGTAAQLIPNLELRDW
jgi:hypothetical protein